MSETMDHRLEIGGNKPPPDPFLVRLEEENAKTLAASTDLEIEAIGLPDQVKSDEDERAITAWVTKARNLGRTVESDRKEAGKPILAMTNTINSFFGGIRDGLTKRANELEARNAPYLKAKREAQEAAAREKARVAREEQEARDLEARAARQRQEEAQRAEAAAALRIREAADAEARAKAEEEMRQAALQQQEEAATAKAAQEASAAAAKAAQRETTVAAGGHALNKTSGESVANVRVNVVYDAVIDDMAALKASLGPLAPYIPETQLDGACKRAATMDRPVIPGVIYVPRDKVKTSPTRRGRQSNAEG